MKITLQEPAETLLRYCRLKKYATLKERIQVVILANEGRSMTKIAAHIERSITFVKKWVKRYREEGFSGLFDKKGRGRKNKLTKEQEQALEQWLTEVKEHQKHSIATLRVSDLRSVVTERLGVAYSLAGMWYVLNRLGFRSLVPRPKHPKQNKEALETWKKEAPFL